MDVAATFCENVVKSFKPGKIYRSRSTTACIGKNGDLLAQPFFFFFLPLLLREGREDTVLRDTVLYFDLRKKHLSHSLFGEFGSFRNGGIS